MKVNHCPDNRSQIRRCSSGRDSAMTLATHFTKIEFQGSRPNGVGNEILVDSAPVWRRYRWAVDVHGVTLGMILDIPEALNLFRQQ